MAIDRVKIDSAISELKQNGVFGFSAAPLYWRILWRLGVDIPPPHFLPLKGHIAWVVPIYLVAFAYLWSHPNIRFGGKSISESFWLSVAVGIFLILATVALNYWWYQRTAKRLHLGSWGEYRPGAMPVAVSTPSRRWKYFVGIPAALIFVPLILLGVAQMLRLTPSSFVLSNDEIVESELDLLASMGLLEPGEEVVAFYSIGFFSIREGGSFLTERRVVNYVESEGQLFFESAAYLDITSVSIDQQGGIVGTVITVSTRDGRALELSVSPEKGGDKMFFFELNDRFRAAHP